MKPQVAQFGSQTPITIVEVDMDQTSSAEYKKYIDKMTSRSIPYTILVDDKGEVVLKLSGYRSSAELSKETRKFIK